MRKGEEDAPAPAHQLTLYDEALSLPSEQRKEVLKQAADKWQGKESYGFQKRKLPVSSPW